MESKDGYHTNMPKFVHMPVLPEFAADINKYGVPFDKRPPFVLVGAVRTKRYPKVTGMFCAVGNEFHAHLLAKKLNQCAVHGGVRILKTEYHANPNFSLKQYFEDLNNAKIRKRTGDR